MPETSILVAVVQRRTVAPSPGAHGRQALASLPMTGRHRAITLAKITLAGAAVGLGALASAGVAGADPDVPPVPADAPPAPGQPYAAPADSAAPPPAPPPVGPPSVPEIPNAQYGQGSSPGPLGFLRDAWRQAKDPYGFTALPPGQSPVGAAPPPGAGPAPQLPPGYTS